MWDCCHEKSVLQKIPASVEVNHGLADGYHVAQFFRLLELL